MHSIALYGGTFDPIHYGHINTSLTIQTIFQFDTYLFLPCKIPALKAPAAASTQQRITMLQLALKPYSQFAIDLREITRKTPSYMVETLRSFRKEFESTAITLILGQDAFYSLPKWYQWEEIITLAHILVIDRKESILAPSTKINCLLEHHETKERCALKHKPFGSIVKCDAGNYPISSTQIREALKKQWESDCPILSYHSSHLNKLLPEVLYHYIMQQELYR